MIFEIVDALKHKAEVNFRFSNYELLLLICYVNANNPKSFNKVHKLIHDPLIDIQDPWSQGQLLFFAQKYAVKK